MRMTVLVAAILAFIAAGVAIAINRNFSASSDTDSTSRVPITSTSSTTMPGTFMLTSSAFENGASIPSRYTCDGSQVNPPLLISGVPESARSLVLVMDDPDVPKQLKPDGVFDHWVLFNIPRETQEIAEGMTVGTPGANSAGKVEYTGPCPPPQYKPSEHRYFFRLYALDTMLDLPAGATKDEVLGAVEGHVLAQAQLSGTYKKK